MPTSQPPPTLIQHLLHQAFESGKELLVQLKTPGTDLYQGKILDLQEDSFTLFHSGRDGGVLWAFNRSDVDHCGLIIDLPDDLKEINLSPSVLKEETHVQSNNL
ncbi:MAG: hypothetical protein K2X01_02320 [Cyanobacteria bacterium]|nr:hypothetical protein [Cyanobacteriota bacterium]